MKVFIIIFVLLCMNTPIFAMKPGEKIPEFSLRDYNGNLHYLSDFCGPHVNEPRVLIVDFFNTLCAPCRKSFDILSRLNNKYKKKGLRIVLISFQEKEKTIREFMKKNKATFSILIDKYGVIAKGFNVKILPSTFIIKNDCTLIKIISGEHLNLEEILEKEITKALRDKDNI